MTSLPRSNDPPGEAFTDFNADPPQGSDDAEDPYSSSIQPISALLGGLIGVLTISVPFATVLLGSTTGLFSIHGSQPPAGIPSAWASEPGGRNSSRMPQ